MNFSSMPDQELEETIRWLHQIVVHGGARGKAFQPAFNAAVAEKQKRTPAKVV